MYKIGQIMYRKLTFLLFLLLAGASFSFAQSSSLTDQYASITAAAEESLLDIGSSNWSVYADEENKLYYVDFESLSININDIVVKRQDGEVVLQEEVFDLPVNTIYEIDFNQFGDGTYDIELRSFTQVLSRTVTIK
jgi:hypothetical protein